MLNARILAPAIAMVLVAACGRPNASSDTGAVPAASEASPAAATPAAASGLTPEVILGKWRGTGSPSSCPQTELAFTKDVFTSVQDGVAHQFRVLGIAWQSQARNEVSVTTGEIDTYQIIDSNNIALEGTFARCPYTRES